MYYPDDPGTQPVADAVALLNRRWKLIAGVTLLVVAGIVGLGEYKESVAGVTFEAPMALGTNPERVGNPNLTLSQAAQVVNSSATAVADAAEDIVGPHPDVSVRASADAATSSLIISARGSDAGRVTEVVSAYSQALIASFAASDEAAFADRVALQEDRIAEAATRLDVAQLALAQDPQNERLAAAQQSALAGYQAALSSLTTIRTEGIPEPELRVLIPPVAIQADIGGFTGLGLPQRAAAGVVLGIMLGVGFAYLRETLDRRLTSSEAAAEAFGVPVLSEIPHGGKSFAAADSLAPAGTVVTEAYRRLRTILELERQSKQRPNGATVILVVSPSPSEGKTTTVAHLSRALGEVGNRVLAVSADFRRPTLHKLLGVEATEGLAKLLDPSDTSNGSSLIQSSPLANVQVITAGKGAHETTELLRATRGLLTEARSRYDFIVVDTSPILSASDALDLVSSSDVVITVAKFRQTSKPAAERTRDMLVNTSAPVLGVVVTGIHAGDGYSSYYYYGGYEPTPERRQPRRGLRESV